ncbi:hypothetical protein ADICEAN_04086 [Cesiribacter andamanensis AMV16]|uniref:Uncharacterized protein n=1 Tax=Cesiribacter andamanensis AMV16 TaxID=1279009 RepID=M7N0H7_9BACT|nr:hypothetical protein ADICEAN_04086 [Cesiribacter andamanensis AMV16]
MALIKSRLHRVGQAKLQVLILRVGGGPVDEQVKLQAGQLLFGQLGELFDLARFAIGHDAGIALAEQHLQIGLQAALGVPHKGAEHQKARALGQAVEEVYHAADRIALHLLPAYGRVGVANAGKEQLEVVVNFGGGAYGRAGVFGTYLLLNGNGRRYAADVLHLGLFHTAQKLPGVGAEAFHIHALPFGKEGIKGQRRFARARYARYHHQLVAGNGHTQVFEIIDAGALDDDVLARIKLVEDIGGRGYCGWLLHR